MTLEKPWARDFDRLVTELKAVWGGEIVAAGESATVDYYLYPEFQGKLDGHPLRVEIKEFPGGGVGFLEGGDNVEYLRVFVPLESEHDLRVSHEDFLQRFRKFIRIEWEFQTGAPEFDKRYWLQPVMEFATAAVELPGLIDIRNFRVLKGSLPPRVLGLVLEWAAQHREELADNWRRARKELPLNRIAPLG